ncbi:hypothetical protein H2203_003391 [Taxawa tesnikishii (nom. ined.)]|nr:hypothetical protein H2203_003391 [Dothideales sp. JES 119]
MGWFWGSKSDSAQNSDPYNKLDPSLRDFLDKESSANHTPTAAPSSKPARAPSSDAASNEYHGRYAHLWKTYKPLAEIEGQMSDQDRMVTVIDAYKERQARIGRAAVENCVFEQIAERECFARGGWHAKMTMCRTEGKAFNRCYQMQARFLKALGYMSSGRTEEEEERLQMHADALYQRMLAQEKAVEEARKEGRAEPSFAPLLSERKEAAKMPAGLEIFRPEKRAAIEKELAGKTPAERELEIQLRVAESKASVEYAEKIKEYYEDDRQKRLDRKERGRATFGDTIKSMWGAATPGSAGCIEAWSMGGPVGRFDAV